MCTYMQYIIKEAHKPLYLHIQEQRVKMLVSKLGSHATTILWRKIEKSTMTNERTCVYNKKRRNVMRCWLRKSKVMRLRYLGGKGRKVDDG